MPGKSDNFTSTTPDKGHFVSCFLAIFSLSKQASQFCCRRKVWLITIAIVVLMWMSIKPPQKPSKMRILQMRSEITLRSLAEHVLAYKQTHSGKAPRMLSDLGVHGQPEKVDMFQVYNGRQNWKTDGWATNKTLVDIYADYVICQNLDIGIIVFERPGLWPDGSVAVCFTNLTKVHVWTSTKTGTGTTETVSEEYQLQVERYPYEKFAELFK